MRRETGASMTRLSPRKELRLSLTTKRHGCLYLTMHAAAELVNTCTLAPTSPNCASCITNLQGWNMQVKVDLVCQHGHTLLVQLPPRTRQVLSTAELARALTKRLPGAPCHSALHPQQGVAMSVSRTQSMRSS